MIRILIVEDQNFPRKAIHAVLESETNLQIVGEAENGVKALELIERLAIDIAIVDLNLPEMDGFELTQKIVQTSSTKVIILSSNEDRDSISKAINCGARGYLVKNNFTKEQIVDTIDRVDRGYFQLAPGIFEKLIDDMINSETIEKLSQIPERYHQISLDSSEKRTIPSEDIRQQLSRELELEIDNLKLELSQGLNKFQYQVSQQIERDLKDVFRDSTQFQSIQQAYSKQHKKLAQNLNFIENNINVIESRNNFLVNKLKRELAILRYCIIFIFILLAPILFDYVLQN